MAVLNDCVCQHVGYCDGSCQHPEPLAARLSAAYEKVAAWPENRMTPNAVEELGEGFTDLLKLRNLVPDVLAYLSSTSAGVTEEQTPRADNTRQLEQVLASVDAIRAEGTSDSPSGYGPPYKAPWFIIDTRSAEPEVNWPGELVEEVDDAGKVSAALHRARIAALAVALEASRVAPVSQYPGVADAIERLHEAAHRDSAVTISVRAQDLRNVLSALASSSVAPVSQKEAEPAFDPMDGGCPHCKWLDTNLGRVLDQKCALHQKIEDLQVNQQMEQQISRSISGVLRAVCEVIRADDDDDPVEVAKERMAEIEELEAAAPAGEPVGIKADERLLEMFDVRPSPEGEANG